MVVKHMGKKRPRHLWHLFPRLHDCTPTCERVLLLVCVLRWAACLELVT